MLSTVGPSTNSSDKFGLQCKDDYFSPWHRNLKINSARSQNSSHKITKTALCNHCGDSSCWVQEELKLQVTDNIENGKLVTEEEKEKTIAVGEIPTEELKEKSYYRAPQQQEEVVFVSNENGRRFEDDAGAAFTIVALLKACAKENNLHKGSQLHSDLVRNGLLENNVFVGSTLVSMYAKCGAVDKAKEVFDELLVKNVVTWNSLIAGYTQHGLGEEALRYFEQMRLGSLSPNAVTFTCALKACGSIGDSDKGQAIHAQIMRESLLQKHVEVANALVDMYSKCGELDKAQGVFDELPVQSVVSWTALIAGYAQYGHGDEALSSFERMQLCGFSPDVVTLSCILKACGSVGAFDKGQEMHAQILRDYMLGQDIVMANALIDMYAKCGALENAQQVFDELPVRDVVSWNTLIAGYAQQGHGKAAIQYFDRMQPEGFFPDAVTFSCALKACARIRDLDKGQEIHAQIVREHLFVTDNEVANAFVDMYAKCGALDNAEKVFDELPARDVVSWNVLIAGYDQHNYGEMALDCFEQMQHEGLSPDAITAACISKACGSIGAAYKGQILHAEIVKHGLLEKGTIALVVMYANCGMLAEAQELFDKLPVRDVVSWSALLEGYAQLGEHEEVLGLFDKMIGEGLVPNSVTFVIVLNACSHGGLLDMGQIHFEIISRSFGIIPALEHYACMVDLFCRAGNLDKAIELIKEMCLSADPSLWHTLLGACQKCGDVKLGRWAFECAVHADQRDAAAYVCMSNMYSAAGRQADARKFEALRVEMQVWNKPEHSWWSDTIGHVHPFSPRWVSQGVCNDAREDVLCGHSERSAIAHALVSTSQGADMCIVKNLRVCVECH